MEVAIPLSTAEVAEQLGLPKLEVIRLIRKKKINAQKMGGWVWAVQPGEVSRVKQTDWYKAAIQRRQS